MPGPPPTDPRLRQRRNKVAGAAKLTLTSGHDVEAPDLPPRVYTVTITEEDGSHTDVQRTGEWHKRALQLWEDLWDSPMAGEYLDADLEGLFMLVSMTDAYWRAIEGGNLKGGLEMGKEIRMQRQAYGLTPVDRRRLQWEVDKGEQAEDSRRKRQRRQVARPDMPTASETFSTLQ